MSKTHQTQLSPKDKNVFRLEWLSCIAAFHNSGGNANCRNKLPQSQAQNTDNKTFTKQILSKSTLFHLNSNFQDVKITLFMLQFLFLRTFFSLLFKKTLFGTFEAYRQQYHFQHIARSVFPVFWLNTTISLTNTITVF